MGELTEHDIEARRAATIILLETRTAWHPTLTSQFARFGAVPGEKATERRKCLSCSGTGELNGRQGKEPCSKCAGQGSFLVDAYTGFRSSDEGAGGKTVLTKLERDRQAVAEIDRMRRQAAPPRTEADLLAEANKQGEPWERNRDRHYAEGSYAELERALDWLGGQSPTARQLLEWTYSNHIITEHAPTVTQAALAALDALNERMPTPIRVPAWLRPHPAAARQSRRRS